MKCTKRTKLDDYNKDIKNLRRKVMKNLKRGILLMLIALLIGCASTQKEEITRAPIYPGCENRNPNEYMLCFQEKIKKHVVDNLSQDLIREYASNGDIYLEVVFLVDKKGNISVLELKAPNQILKDEIIRIFKKLPKMQPCLDKGEAKEIEFVLPIRLTTR